MNYSNGGMCLGDIHVVWVGRQAQTTSSHETFQKIAPVPTCFHEGVIEQESEPERALNGRRFCWIKWRAYLSLCTYSCRSASSLAKTATSVQVEWVGTRETVRLLLQFFLIVNGIHSMVSYQCRMIVHCHVLWRSM